MLVQFGNTAPLENGKPMVRDAPCVTYVNLQDYGFTGEVSVPDAKVHLYDSLVNRDGITNLPGDEALVAMIHGSGAVSAHSSAKPSWIWADNEGFAAYLGEFYGCPVGIPGDVEDTHHTLAGPPGVVPGAVLDMEMNVTQNGRDIVARNLGGAVLGASGVSTTAPTATTYTMTGTGAPGSTTAWNGQRIMAGSTSVGIVWGYIVSNTNASPPVVTIDRWYNPATPGGAAATTPVVGPYAVIDGGAPGWFVGISVSTTAVGGPPDTHTALTSEYTTAGGGLVRQIAPYAHTASAATWTLIPVYTVNSTDVSSGGLPLTFDSYGVFNSMVVGTAASMLYYNLFSASAVLASLGDQLTLTITVTTT
jgi:hypothetical protein